MLTPSLEASEEYWGDWRWVPTSIGFILGCAFVAIGGSLNCIDDSLAVYMGHGHSHDDHDANDPTRPQTSLSRTTTKSIPEISSQSFKRIVALCLAITIHNIPEGAAVGVGFGSGNVVTGSTVTLAIALQNFPEGLAVAMPLRAAGMSKFMAFFWGQLSGFIGV